MFPYTTPPAEPDVVERESEWPKIEAWRLHVLIEAGYPVAIAERVASRPDIDLHRAVALVEGGCPAGVAANILL